MHLIFSDDSYYKYSCRNIPPDWKQNMRMAEKPLWESNSIVIQRSFGLFLLQSECVQSHFKNNSNRIVSGECWCSDVARKAPKLRWQAPRKQLQLQPPLLRLWAAPATKWTKRFGKQGQNVFKMSSVTVSFQATPASSVKVLHSCCRMSAFGHKLEYK